MAPENRIYYDRGQYTTSSTAGTVCCPSFTQIYHWLYLNFRKASLAANIDVSRGAQIRDIESSFAACNNAFDISTLSHPNKRGVTAVDSYEIFPDADIWANAYDLFRFSERPGERAADVEDPRLDCAILRPMESDGDHFLAYYLTEDDESALKFKEKRLTLSPYESPDQNEVCPISIFISNFAFLI